MVLLQNIYVSVSYFASECGIPGTRYQVPGMYIPPRNPILRQMPYRYVVDGQQDGVLLHLTNQLGRNLEHDRLFWLRGAPTSIAAFASSDAANVANLGPPSTPDMPPSLLEANVQPRVFVEAHLVLLCVGMTI